jgi:hypothetical protein
MTCALGHTVAHEAETNHEHHQPPHGFVYTDRHSPVKLEKPSEEESFTFAIFGDRTGGLHSGLRVLEKAVAEINAIGPDLVMTVGDLVQGYNQRSEWLMQMGEFKLVMNRLVVPWFPVAGNHDVYWRGDGRPEKEHDGDYESHFGPLWYAFEHKDCWFIVLYSDEGNPDTGEKNFNKAECQTMSPQQTAFLAETLKLAQDADHVFVFLHHPRWTGGKYGNDWDRIHQLLKDAGNVSACFAGHTHTMKFDGAKDNIEYYTLATTGGHVPKRTINPLVGALHHYDLVTVRGDRFYVAAVPIGSVIDPKAKRLTRMLLPEKTWSIQDEQSRTLKYPIEIPPYEGTGAILNIGVAHALDDNGDRGVTYEVHSAEGQIIQRGFLTASDYEWIKCPVAPDQHLVFLLKDEDTSFETDAPGNGGQIQIELEIIKR